MTDGGTRRGETRLERAERGRWDAEGFAFCFFETYCCECRLPMLNMHVLLECASRLTLR